MYVVRRDGMLVQLTGKSEENPLHVSVLIPVIDADNSSVPKSCFLRLFEVTITLTPLTDPTKDRDTPRMHRDSLKHQAASRDIRTPQTTSTFTANLE